LERELERELEELKSKQSGDQTVQELLRLNKALEEELMRLKENMGVPMIFITVPCTRSNSTIALLAR
jgi:hypothetical protein